MAARTADAAVTSRYTFAADSGALSDRRLR